MSSTSLSPYLAFNGNCREAMNFYHSVLGGELELHTFEELKMTGIPDDYKTKIMHGMIKTDGLSFMASDAAPGSEYNLGSNVSLAITGTDSEKLKQFWKELSESGHVTFELAKQTWGDEYGMFIDKFGFNWMFNIIAKQAQA